ncbi:hypothetical protein KY289_036419 [Solanum tuberosum]|nr:hypothetical protein KY289_036419 [Solanum tuberosum]
MIDEYKNKNGGWRKLSEKVWAKVDIPMGIKFGALENEANKEEVIESPEEREGQGVEGSSGKQHKGTSSGEHGSHTTKVIVKSMHTPLHIGDYTE